MQRPKEPNRERLVSSCFERLWKTVLIICQILKIILKKVLVLGLFELCMNFLGYCAVGQTKQKWCFHHRNFLQELRAFGGTKFSNRDLVYPSPCSELALSDSSGSLTVGQASLNISHCSVSTSFLEFFLTYYNALHYYYWQDIQTSRGQNSSKQQMCYWFDHVPNFCWFWWQNANLKSEGIF